MGGKGRGLRDNPHHQPRDESNSVLYRPALAPDDWTKRTTRDTGSPQAAFCHTAESPGKIAAKSSTHELAIHNTQYPAGFVRFGPSKTRFRAPRSTSRWNTTGVLGRVIQAEVSISPPPPFLFVPTSDCPLPGCICGAAKRRQMW